MQLGKYIIAEDVGEAGRGTICTQFEVAGKIYQIGVVPQGQENQITQAQEVINGKTYLFKLKKAQKGTDTSILQGNEILAVLLEEGETENIYFAVEEVQTQ